MLTERASESGPTECTRTQRGRGTRTEEGEGGLRKAWRCFNISVSYSVCPVWGYVWIESPACSLAQKLGRMSAR